MVLSKKETDLTREIKYPEQRWEIASEKRADNGSAHCSWVLRTNLFTHRSCRPARITIAFACASSPRSLRYLNTTISGGPGLTGLISQQPHLHCRLLTPHAPSQKPGPASSFRALGLGPAPRQRRQPACHQHRHPVSVARYDGISISALTKGSAPGEVRPGGGVRGKSSGSPEGVLEGRSGCGREPSAPRSGGAPGGQQPRRG